MPLPRVNKCCCCVDLTLGVKILAGLSITGGIFGIFRLFTAFSTYNLVVNIINIVIGYRQSMSILLFINIVSDKT